MSNVNEEMANADTYDPNCPVNMNDITPNLHSSRKYQKHQISNIKTYSLRPKNVFKNGDHLSVRCNNVESLSSLLCKPMSVSLMRLTDSDLKQLHGKPPEIKNIRNRQKKQQLFKFYGRGKKKGKHGTKKAKCSNDNKMHKEIHENKVIKDITKNVVKNVDKKDCKNANEKVSENIFNEIQLQISAASTVQRSSNITQSKEDLFKNIKQPTITLSRIDEVINKLAQSFAKVITNKQSNTVIHEPVKQHLAVIQTEKIGLISQQSPTSTNGDDYSRVSKIGSSISDTNESENLQDKQKVDDKSDNLDSDSDLFPSRRKSKRKCGVIYESSNEADSDELQEETLIQIKRVKLSPPQKETIITIEKYDTLNEEQTESSPKINAPKKVLGFSNKTSIETDVQDKEVIAKDEKIDAENIEINYKNGKVNVEEDKLDGEEVNVDNDDEEIDVESIEVDNKQEDGVNDKIVNEACNLVAIKNTFQENTKCIEKNCASNLLASEDCLKVRDTSCTSENEVVLYATEVQKQLYKSCMSDNELIQKYNLCKKARVLLIDLLHIKSSLDNKYSAVEIEQLTQRYINLLLNSNLSSRDDNVAESNFSSINDLRSNLQPGESESHTVELKDIKNITRASNVIMDKKKDIEHQQCTLTMENGYIQIKFKKTSDSNIKQTTFPSSPIKKSTKHSEFSNVNVNSPTDASSFSNCGKLSEQTDMTQSKSLTVIADSLNNIGKPLTSEKESSSLKEHLRDTTVQNRKTDGKQLTTISASLVSPTKHKKAVERKEISKGKDFSNSYKCIVCDLCFEDYSSLQQHLSKHAKETTKVSLSPSKPTTLIKNVEMLKGMQVKVLFPSASGSAESQQSNNEGSTLQAVSSSTSVTDKQDSLQKRIARTKHKKHKVLRPSNDTNECNVCFHEFPSRTDLAAHIFSHTESELQGAFEIAKQSVKKGKKIVESETQKAKNDTNESSNNVDDSEKNCSKASAVHKQDEHSVKKFSKSTNESQKNCSKILTDQKQDEQSSMDSESRISEQVNGTRNIKTNKSVSLGEHNSKSNQTSSANKTEKIRTHKAIHNKKLFTICQCHNKADSNFNCLKIEIVLLCHTCRVLFRSIECFESHYRLSQYSVCNQNRFDNGRSPNLFCASCGMIFSSVQDVRQHLETHVRFNQNCVMDFRCNICKVIFIGIGPLFYVHWSKHTKNSFWVGNEQSFPKSSIINLKLKNEKGACKPGEFTLDKYIDNYIYVGEYICRNCKLIFIDDCHFKVHKQTCKEVNSAKSQNVQSIVEEKQFKLRLICSLCHENFSKELDLYMHMKNKHKFATDPQFVCVSLTDVERTFICSICMEVTETIDQFNKHWLKHYVSQPCFICTNCKQNCNSLDTFLEHVKEHDCRTKEDTISCSVNYQDVQFVCKLCHVGFQDQKWLSEHDIIHNLNKQKKNKKKNEVTNQESSTLNPEANNVCNTLKTTESTIEKMFEQFVKIENDRDNNAIGENTVQCSQSSADLDKERLINILEGNEEDDSENELVIDLTERSESHNESVIKDRPNEKQIILSSTLNTNASSVSEILLPKSGSLPRKHISGIPSKEITISSSDAVSSDNIGTPTSSQNMCLQETQDTHIKEPLESNDTVKQKRGFLRVKTLAELVGNANSLHVCKVCQCSFKFAEDLTQHSSTHTTQKQSKESLQENNPISQQPSSSTGQKKLIICPSSRVIIKPLTKVAKAIPILKPLISPTNNAKVLVTKPHTAVTSSQSSMSAYHKNLPACNIVRKISTPRSITQITARTPMSVAVSSSKVQNIQVTSATISSNDATCLNTTTSKTLNTDLDSNIHANNKMVYRQYYPKRSMVKNHSNMDNATTSNVNCPSSNQNFKQTQYTTQNQTKVNSPRIYYQYPNSDANYSGNVQTSTQNPQIRTNQPVTRNPSSAFYYNNSSSGGMSIVINQTTPALPNLSTVDIRQQQEPQPQMYPPVYSNPVVSVNPYTQQSQVYWAIGHELI
ncbi:uncharacterized protein LOC116424505 isoform X2 [Nomia melanderi]|nr:uncharacterized protein LOC116424505 isoform X2 [Nomia melanderi]